MNNINMTLLQDNKAFHQAFQALSTFDIIFRNLIKSNSIDNNLLSKWEMYVIILYAKRSINLHIQVGYS